jgi:hypothetical protein
MYLYDYFCIRNRGFNDLRIIFSEQLFRGLFMNYNLILDSQLVFHFHLFVLSIRKKTKYSYNN